MPDEKPLADDVDEHLRQIERAAEMDAEANYRVLDNHLLHSDRVIANIAAVSTARDGDELLKALSENPT